MDEQSRTEGNDPAAQSRERKDPTWVNVLALLLWLTAGAVAFLPFAFDTSPWDAVTLRVPSNQGNWWHLLIGVPFFLAYPMIWLRLRALLSTQLSTALERRLIWAAVAFSVGGTTLVQIPFLLHLAGTSGWPRLSMLSLGFGILITSAVLLFIARRRFSPTRACLVGLDTAYLANAGLCLVVYSGATGDIGTRSGWLVSSVVVWLIVFELISLFVQTFRAQGFPIEPHAAHQA